MNPRPHRRAVAQLLLGLVPLLVVGAVLLVVLLLRLADARAPLAAASATAEATVTASGQDPDGRGVEVTFTDDDGRDRQGRLLLREAVEVPLGLPVTVAYDPDAAGDGPQDVYTDGDEAHRSVGDLLFGLVVLVVVLVVATALTGVRVLSRRRLRRGLPTPVPATHLLVQRGLVQRSWLELGTAQGTRWLPVFWSAELAALAPDQQIEVRGALDRGGLVLPVLDGAQVWPSGRLRSRRPRGTVTVAVLRGIDAPPVGMGRQARSDAVVPCLAPVLGLLWAYVDSSGVAGFVVATVLAAAVLFWLQQLLGSAPSV